MSTDEPTADHLQVGAEERGTDQPGTDQAGAMTAGILSLVLGLIAAMGGGTLASAFQYWAFEVSSQEDTGFVVQTASAVPPIVLGIVAVALGLVAARSSHTTASASGKAGAVVGALAVIGGLVLAIALGTSDFF